MDDHINEGDDAERHHRRASDATGKRGSRRWLNYGRRPMPAFKRRELAARRIGSPESSVAGSSFAGASSSRTITPVKRRPEELGLLVVKLEDDVVPLRGGVIGPEDSSSRDRRITSCAPSWSAR
ncbi:Alpha-1,4-glucan-protein synthase [Hordeum vulgare]|nr:Alpha-1,4-glucan-protein synthase [Hordeum vulgare]